MNQYVNGFSCAQDENGDELSIRFSQNAPTFDEHNDICGSGYEAIASIVMTTRTARSLADAILSILDASSDSDQDTK